jgi:hypothetical protein
MIIDFIINVIYNLILFLVDLIALAPDVVLNSNITGSLSQIAPYYISIDTVFPIGALLAILFFELAYEGAYLLYKLIRWAYIKIPGIS